MTEKMEEAAVFDLAPFPVEAGKIREFALALGLTDSVYFDREAANAAGYRDIPAPPTFATAADYWNERDLYKIFGQSGLGKDRVLYGEQAYDYRKDVFAGDVLTGRLRVADRFEKRGKTFMLTETIYRNQHDDIVLIGKSTFIRLPEADA